MKYPFIGKQQSQKQKVACLGTMWKNWNLGPLFVEMQNGIGTV